MITKEGGGTGIIGMGVKYRKLLCYASNCEIFWMFFGWFFALLGGFAMPSWVFLMGDIIDAFDPSSTL